MTARKLVNIFATIGEEELDIIRSNGCDLIDVERNPDGTIGPHVSALLKGDDDGIYQVLMELDTCMNCSR